MTWISELHRLYWNMADLWEKDPKGLEAMGAGFQITLQTLRDRAGKIAARLQEYACLADQVLKILETNLPLS